MLYGSLRSIIDKRKVSSDLNCRRIGVNRRGFIVASSLAVAGIGLGTAYWNRRWEYIVIHHTAGNFATIEFLQQVHRERQSYDPIDAIPYHYVIGNGNGLGMGEIASDWRQEYGLWGSHVSASNRMRNVLGIGICLVGNFEEGGVPRAQFDALVALTKQLMVRYDIPAANVTGHGMIPGESTKCPGKHFPIVKFQRAIA
jgi:N-acetylmuramoyl-L-alanine amidase